MDDIVRGRGSTYLLDAIEALRGVIGNIGALIAGFVFGAVFWHFVGFWGFVSGIVYAPQVPVLMQAQTHTHSEPQGGAHQSAGDAGHVSIAASGGDTAACTDVVLDRASGATSLMACASGWAMDMANPPHGREDREPARGEGGERS